MNRAFLLLAALALAACGGNVVVDTGAGGGQSGTTTTTTTTDSTFFTGSCPTPMPAPCSSILECACADGTTQIGGCPNGFTCPEACCGHGGAAGG